MKKILLIILFSVTIAKAGSQNSKEGFFGDIAAKSDLIMFHYLKENEETGIWVKNEEQIKLKAIYIKIADTPEQKNIFELAVRSTPEITPGRNNKLTDFKDLIIGKIICRPTGAGVYKIDVEKFDIRISSYFAVMLFPCSESESYKRDAAETEYDNEGKFASYEVKNRTYYGPIICSYAKPYNKMIYWAFYLRKGFCVCPLEVKMNQPQIMVEYAKQ